MTTLLKMFCNKYDADHLPPHYDDLSIKADCLPSYDETITFSKYQIPENSTIYSKLIDTLYKMGPKSYIKVDPNVFDPNVFDLEKLAIELAINNHTKLTLFKFYQDFKTNTTKISININNKTIVTTKDLVILGFSDIDITIDGKQNMKHPCNIYAFQIANGKYIASCLHSPTY